jgi:hypothetical protein
VWFLEITQGFRDEIIADSLAYANVGDPGAGFADTRYNDVVDSLLCTHAGGAGSQNPQMDDTSLLNSGEFNVTIVRSEQRPDMFVQNRPDIFFLLLFVHGFIIFRKLS